jgi:hypothetical protein
MPCIMKNISWQSFECAVTKMNRAGSQKFLILVVAKTFFWFSSSSLYSCITCFKHCSLRDKIFGISMFAKVIGFAVRFLVNILLICRLKVFISGRTWGTRCTSPPMRITCAAGATSGFLRLFATAPSLSSPRLQHRQYYGGRASGQTVITVMLIRSTPVMHPAL